MFQARQTNVSPLNLEINDHSLTSCKSSKFPDVTLETTSFWKHHCETLTRKKIRSKCYAFKCLQLQIAEACLLSLYYAQIYFRKRHFYSGWISRRRKIFLIRKAALRRIYGAHITKSCCPVFDLSESNKCRYS